ncbi:MAG: ComF family protein [Pseudonocardiaceae bacterium]|nr:ComF family protein [Pseudonocardiaceae bacterium]
MSSLLNVLLPPSCAGCGRPGAACCVSCAHTMRRPRPVRCERLAVPCYALAGYQGVPRRMVLAYKERGRRDLGEELGRLLATALPRLPGTRPDVAGWALVPAPSRRAASRVRGGPHMTRIARYCAAELAAHGRLAGLAPALRLDAAARDAVGLDHAARAANLSGRLRLVPGECPAPGTRVVLLDDVLTTGATAAACVRVLGEAGVPVDAVLAITAAHPVP